MRTTTLIGVMTLFLVACVHTSTFENVRLGMSKEEVVKAAGHPNSIIATNKVDNDLVEVFEYRKEGIWWGDDSYWFFFSNNTLQKWGRPYDHYYLD